MKINNSIIILLALLCASLFLVSALAVDETKGNINLLINYYINFLKHMDLLSYIIKYIGHACNDKK